jgi:hypothetical protein
VTMPSRNLSLFQPGSLSPFLLPLVCVVLFSLVVAELSISAGGGSGIGVVDLLQYWGSAQIVESSGNPYDPVLQTFVQREVWKGPEVPVLMWNPPFLIPLVWPLRFVSFPVAVPVFFCLSVCSYIVAVAMIRRAYPVPTPNRFGRVAVLFFLGTFYPLTLCLAYGQISCFFLLAFILAFLRLRSDGLPNSFLGGVVLSLTLVKPHLLFLVYLLIILESIRSQTWKTVEGILTGSILLGGLAMVIEPKILWFYLQAFQSPPLYWKTPTIGSWLQELGGRPEVVRNLPALLAMSVFIFFHIRHPDKDWSGKGMHVLLPLSLAFSPYGWVYDHILLLVPLFYVLDGSVGWYHKGDVRPLCFVIAALFHATLLFYFVPSTFGQQWYLWFPFFVLALVVRFSPPKETLIHG